MMKNLVNRLLVLMLSTSFMAEATAQENINANSSTVSFKRAYFGFGAGLDYGGLGLKAEFLPIKHIGFFGGVGYNLNDPAYNVGISVKVLPDKKVQPVLLAMYGYNAVLLFKDRRDRSKTYYGTTVGAGCEIRLGTHGNKVSLAVLAPFRSDEFQTRYKALKDAGYKFSPDILPVVFSVGVNFAIDKTGKK